MQLPFMPYINLDYSALIVLGCVVIAFLVWYSREDAKEAPLPRPRKPNWGDWLWYLILIAILKEIGLFIALIMYHRNHIQQHDAWEKDSKHQSDTKTE